MGEVLSSASIPKSDLAIRHEAHDKTASHAAENIHSFFISLDVDLTDGSKAGKWSGARVPRPTRRNGNPHRIMF
jgi:hypothetical protein